MEYGAFDKVPKNKRTFSFLDQTVFWFSAATIPAAWYYGALMAGWNGILAALLFIIGINALSFIPWAYLGKMAAQTGGSSMAIVRPAFGTRGSIIPSIFYLILGAGWAVTNVFLGSIALSFIFKLWLGWPSYLDPNNTTHMIAYIFLVCIIQGIFTITGSRGLRKIHWVATLLFLLLGAYQTYIVFTHWNVVALFSWQPKHALTFVSGPFTFPLTFAVLFDLMVAYNWTWEYIGDFSRFAKTEKAGTWGPFLGATISQIWWFLVGAIAVAYLAVSSGKYSPLLADPSSATVTLGLGWLAAFIVLLATVASNAGNLYASALGISNMTAHRKQIPVKKLLWIVAIAVTPLCLIPLLASSFVNFYIFFLDFLGAIVVPLWTLTLVDYFLVKRQNYSDDMFKITGGRYWYNKGWNVSGVATLLLGVVVYWVLTYIFPGVKQSITATIPTMIVVAVSYLLLSRTK